MAPQRHVHGHTDTTMDAHMDKTTNLIILLMFTMFTLGGDSNSLYVPVICLWHMHALYECVLINIFINPFIYSYRLMICDMPHYCRQAGQSVREMCWLWRSRMLPSCCRIIMTPDVTTASPLSLLPYRKSARFWQSTDGVRCQMQNVGYNSV